MTENARTESRPRKPIPNARYEIPEATMSAPTCELRWSVASYRKAKLEQKWICTHYINSAPFEQYEEWREIPSIDEPLST